MLGYDLFYWNLCVLCVLCAGQKRGHECV
jgi:hypothetical protein